MSGAAERVLDAEATRHALPFDRLIDALRRAFAAGAIVVPERHVHEIAPPPAAVTSLIMPAWLPGHAYGVKIVNVGHANAARGLPALHSTYVLYDATSGAPLALLDGDEITTRRTAATSALAADFLAPRDARHLLVVGAGRIARVLPEAHRTVRPGLDRVSVWARSPREAEALAAAWRRAGLDAAVIVDLEAAVRGADIVSCATRATVPLVRGAWLCERVHLDLIGSFAPDMREADAACFADAEIVVDNDEALRKAGDLLDALAAGTTRAGGVSTLQALCAGRAPPRRAARSVFKSVGSALEDLAAALLAVDSQPRQ